jgi:hypothetical protein
MSQRPLSRSNSDTTASADWSACERHAAETGHFTIVPPEATAPALERGEWQGEGETFMPTRRAPEATGAPEPMDLVRELNAAAYAEGRIVATEAANGHGWTEHCAVAEQRRMAAIKALRATVAALTAERAQEQQRNAGGSTGKSEPPTAAAPNQQQEPEPKGEG